MSKKPWFAAFLPLIAPGLGQIYCGEGIKGGAIQAGAIGIGNLNLIFLSVLVAANPDPGIVWAYWIPRLGYDVMSVWSVVFWIWVVVDGYWAARKE